MANLISDELLARIKRTVEQVERTGAPGLSLPKPRLILETPAFLLGKTTTGTTKGSTGTAKIYIGDYGTTGAETVTPTTYSVGFFSKFGDLMPDKWVALASNGYGYYAVATEFNGILLGKTDAAINKAASGTVSIWTGTPGSETDSTVNVTAYNRFANVAISKWVMVGHNSHGWYLIAAEC